MDKKSNNMILKHNTDYNKVNNLICIIYVILVNLPIMFKGGYFEKEFLPGLMGLNILFLIWLFIQRKNYEFKIFNNPIEILFSCVFIMYLLSTIYGVDKKGSIIESMKYFSYFATMVLAINLSKDKRHEGRILNFIILGSIIVSIIGVGTAIGTFNYTDAVLGGRISSTLQYPNTLAAYVGSIYFITLTMLINSNNKAQKSIYGAALGILIFTFILTYSRAMWLMFPVSVMLYFIFIPSSRKLETIVYILGSLIVSVPFSFLFTRGMSEPSSSLWIIFLIVVIGTGLIIAALSLLDNKYRATSIKILVTILTILFILIAALGLYAINTTTEITLNNETDENKLTSLNRNILDVQPSTDYVLEFSYSGQNTSNAAYLGRVVINSINDTGETIQLSVENIIETGQNVYMIPFSTQEDSVAVRISFRNVYPGTSFTVQESTIVEANNNESEINVPLKYKYIPESIVSRFNSITAGESSLSRRITFNKDGLEIVKKYPLLGTGGEGWRTLYQAYQSEPYVSNLAHNFFLQLWIEIGLIGLLLMIFILLLLTSSIFRMIRKSEDDNYKSLIVGLFVTMFTMFFHAFVDFDMSLSGYAIIVWIIVGLLSSNLHFTISILEKRTSKPNKANMKIYIYSLLVLTIVFISAMVSFILGGVYAHKAVIANESNDIKAATTNFEKAVLYDGFEHTYRIDLSNLYMSLYSLTGDVEYVGKALELVEKNIEQTPYNTQVVSNAVNFYFSIGEIDKALEYLEKSVVLQPLSSQSYIQKLDGYFAVYDYYYFEGKDRRAKEALKESLTVKEQIAEVNARSEKPLNENIDLVYKIGRAQFYLDNFGNLMEIASRDLTLDFAYYFDLDANNDQIPDMLRVSRPKGSNVEYEVHQDKENFIRITNDGDKSGFIYPYGIKLQPNTSYVVEINARGNTKQNTFRAYAWSNGSAEPNQGGLAKINLTENWSTYSFDFTTDSDVEPGRQYIRLQHSGKDEGYIDIKNLAIYEVDN